MPSPLSAVSVDCRVSPAIAFRTVRTCDSGTITAVSVSRRRPVRLARRRSRHLRVDAVEEVVRQPLEQPLPDPPGGGQLVVVAGDARGRELVDVGEDELGEPGQGLRVDTVAHRGGGHLPPGDAGADPVGGEQGVDRPAAARLAPAELVGAVDGGCGRGLRRPPRTARPAR